jgi:Zn-dependent peptidase ImmA (M78 family)
VYLDASDAVASQIFTLVHELAHLWVGTSGLSNPKETLVADSQPIEIFCNRVAAETLVPLSEFKEAWDQALPLDEQCHRLSEKFCVSPLIILRRAYDASFLDGVTFHSAYHSAVERADRVSQIKAAGRKPLTALQRVGKNLGEMLAAAAQTHRIDEHEAMALLAAGTEEEVWSVCGSHDQCTQEEAAGQDARYAHLAATA